MPAVPPALLRHLAGLDGDWVVPAWWETDGGEPRIEPLCALYRPPALAALARRVAAGAFELRGLAEENTLSIRRVSRGELESFGAPEAIFANVNRPADLAALAALRQAPCPSD
jgi:molybdopterin-guanine dinucleotide biosynthesis protein A